MKPALGRDGRDKDQELRSEAVYQGSAREKWLKAGTAALRVERG